MWALIGIGILVIIESVCILSFIFAICDYRSRRRIVSMSNNQNNRHNSNNNYNQTDNKPEPKSVLSIKSSNSINNRGN